MMRKLNTCSLYYIALVIYFINETIANSIFSRYFIPQSLLNLVYISLIFLKIVLSRKISVRELLIWLCGVTLFVFLFYMFGYTKPMIIILFLLGAEKCSAEVIAKIHLRCVGTLVFFLTLLSQVGVIQDRLFYRSDGYVRHSLGMSYVTIWAGIVGFLLIEYIYLHRKNLKIRHIVLYIIIVTYSYIMTDTRVELAINLLFLVIIILYDKIKNKQVVFKVLVWAFPIGAVIAGGVEALYLSDTAKYAFLNNIFSQRLYETAKVLAVYPITFLGSYVKMQGNGTLNFDSNIGYFFIDSVYLNYMVQFGIVFFAFVTVIIVFISFALYKQNKKFMLILLALAALHGVAISSVLVPYFNPLYIIAVASISNTDESEDDFLGFHTKFRVLYERK